MGLFDNIGQDVSDGFNSIVATGAPAIIAGAEDYAAQQLQQSSAQTKAAATVAAAKAPPAKGIFASIESAFGQTQVGAFIQNNYVYIIGGMIVTGAVVYMAMKKR